ncbi:hypothetical protein B0H11DRAFT_300165 [Mycena galericulata]|nr:hypothetical protein B0H11DRAFT_300165 [Mycena galericulata]
MFGLTPSRVFTAVVLLAATAANAQEHNGTAYPFIPRFGGICNFKPDIADATFVASVSFEFFRDYKLTGNGDKNPPPPFLCGHGILVRNRANGKTVTVCIVDRFFRLTRGDYGLELSPDAFESLA